MSTAAPEAESTGALGMTTIEKMARAIEPLAWARLGLHDTHVAADRRARSLTQAKAALQALREPGEGMIGAMSQTPGVKEVDAMVAYCAARNPAHRLTWADKGEASPLVQAFTAAIDHILGEA